MMKAIALAAIVGACCVVTLPGCAVTSGQSSTGQYVDDVTITSRVKTRFAEDKNISAMRIGVETLKGEVLLSGFATSEEEKTHAAEVAQAVPGVKSVRNEIKVSPAIK